MWNEIDLLDFQIVHTYGPDHLLPILKKITYVIKIFFLDIITKKCSAAVPLALLNIFNQSGLLLIYYVITQCKYIQF